MEVTAMSTANEKARFQASLEARIDDARRGVGRAQAELLVAVNSLAPEEVGDKQLITRGLEQSFQKVRLAQDYVVDLQQLLERV
jgi:hypothetical protein